MIMLIAVGYYQLRYGNPAKHELNNTENVVTVLQHLGNVPSTFFLAIWIR
jgi:hypothetical protein